MSTPSFRQFMKQRIRDGSPISFFRYAGDEHGPSDMSRDFINDALCDKKFPIIKTFDQLYDYMRSCGACSGAVEGGLDTWADWTLYRISCGEYETK